MVYSASTNWVWLSVHKFNNGNYHFSLLRRMRPKGTKNSHLKQLSPYGLVSSVQYRDLLLLFHHAQFLLNFATRLVEEVEEFELQTLKHYDDLNANYFAILQRDIFDSGGISFPVFPISATRELLRRKFELCKLKQARKAKLYPNEGVPVSIDELWREFNSFNFGGGSPYLQTK